MKVPVNNRIKRQAISWQTMFSSCLSDKRVIFRIQRTVKSQQQKKKKKKIENGQKVQTSISEREEIDSM